MIIVRQRRIRASNTVLQKASHPVPKINHYDYGDDVGDVGDDYDDDDDGIGQAGPSLVFLSTEPSDLL